MFWPFYFSAGFALAVAGSRQHSHIEHALLRSRRQSLPQERADEEGCPLPSPMENGRYSPNFERCPPHISNSACKVVPGTLVPPGWDLFYSCDDGYVLNSTEKVSYCVAGQWSPSLPGCVAGEPCLPLKSLDVSVNCSYQGTVVSCNVPAKPGTIAVPECKHNYKPAYQPSYTHLTCLNNGYWDYPLFHCTPEQLCPALKPVNMKLLCIFHDKAVPCDRQVKPGTIAIPECKYHYRPAYDPGYSNLTCLNNGNWDHDLFYCTPECGASNEVSHLKPLIVDGLEAHVGAFPWHAGLYYPITQEFGERATWVQRCGGSLITDRFVLTAAHCVENVKEENIRVALGKFYRSWDRYEHSEEKRNVSKIIHPRDYNKKTYLFDIALLLLNRKIKTGQFIMPVCHGFLDGSRYIENKNLFLAGWGRIEDVVNGRASETLLYNDVKMESPNICHDQPPYSFPVFDKFCAKKNTSKVSIAQQGDSGGGLTSVYDGLHYIFGIVSIKFNDYTFFTNITWPFNMIWIEGEVRKYHSDFHWIGNEITKFQNRSRTCKLPVESVSRRFCSLAEGCEDCSIHDRRCFIPPGSEVERVRVVCNPGYSLRNRYSGGDVATCLSGGSWYPHIPDCINVIGEKYIPGSPWSKVTWKTAKDNCEAAGHRLATVKTRDQQVWFEDAVSKHFNDKGTLPASVWIGLVDTEYKRRFAWVDESDFRASEDEVAPWLSKEPNNLRGGEKCVQAMAGDDMANWPHENPYQWNDAACGGVFYYLCKKISEDTYIPGIPWKKVTWQEAKNSCLAKGTQLAIIKSKDQQKLFEEAAAGKFRETGENPSSIWIGLTDISGERRFEWVNGPLLRRYDYSKWQPNEPNNAFGTEKCGHAVPKGAPEDTHKTSLEWNDMTCTMLKFYFCMNGNTFIKGDPWKAVTWQEALNNCEAKGYQLPVILNEEQQDMFEEAVANSFKDESFWTVSLWLGLKTAEGRTFEWVDGSVLEARVEEVAKWLPNEPNNAGGQEHCVQAVAGKDFEPQWPGGKPYEWNDDTCSLKKYYFCEKNTGSTSKTIVPGSPWSKVTWETARDNCNAMGHQLVTIKNGEEQNKFKEAVEKKFKQTGSAPSSIWIGLRDDRKLEWVDSSDVEFTHWLPGEPNSQADSCTEAIAGEGLRPWKNGKPFKWNDKICSWSNYYFCSSYSSEPNNSGISYSPGEPWQKVTWENAKENCQAQGKVLALIKNEEQQKLFEEAATKQFKETGTTLSQIWIGLKVARPLKWVDGSSLSYTAWVPGEPNNAGGQERCVEAVTAIDLFTPKWPKGGLYEWNDTGCSLKLYYFCIEKK